MTFTACHFGGNDMETTERTKFCKHCGAKIPEDAVLCTACGRQVEKLENESAPNIVINNSNSSQNANKHFFRRHRIVKILVFKCHNAEGFAVIVVLAEVILI